jgi:16S rRNA processing protein RimM
MAEPTVVVGKVTRAHGLHGEVSVLVFSDNPQRFEPGSDVFLEDGTRLTIRSARGSGSTTLIAFEGLTDRSAAERVRGRTLVVPESMLPPLPAGEYWPHQLEGCDVVTESGRRLGSIIDVIPNPANDLWVARDEAGTETLVPAIKDVVMNVDVAAKRVLVRDIPGLTLPED